MLIVRASNFLLLMNINTLQPWFVDSITYISIATSQTYQHMVRFSLLSIKNGLRRYPDDILVVDVLTRLDLMKDYS